MNMVYISPSDNNETTICKTIAKKMKEELISHNYRTIVSQPSTKLENRILNAKKNEVDFICSIGCNNHESSAIYYTGQEEKKLAESISYYLNNINFSLTLVNISDLNELSELVDIGESGSFFNLIKRHSMKGIVIEFNEDSVDNFILERVDDVSKAISAGVIKYFVELPLETSETFIKVFEEESVNDCDINTEDEQDNKTNTEVKLEDSKKTTSFLTKLVKSFFKSK